jgi:hypothetical protein
MVLAMCAPLLAAPKWDVRYLLPIIPATALVTWLGISLIRSLWWRRLTGLGLVAWCVAQLAVLSSWGIVRSFGPWRYAYTAFGVPWLHGANLHGLVALPMPDGIIEAVGSRLQAFARGAKRAPRVLLLTSGLYDNAHTVRYEAVRRNIEIQLWGLDHRDPPREQLKLWEQPYDLVLYREPTDEEPEAFRRLARLMRYHLPSGRYELVERLPVPGGGVFEVYAARDHF